MSELSTAECQAEAYDIIKREWFKEYGNYPTDEELQEEYKDFCERYGDQ